MLAGPDLLVVLAIALVVFGPKKLPDLAKTIGKALAEFKKTTDEIKDSVGINELGRIRSSLTDVDLLTDLAEKVSTSMVREEGTGQTSESSKDTASLSASAPIPPEAGKHRKRKKTKIYQNLFEIQPIIPFPFGDSVASPFIIRRARHERATAH